MLTTSTDSLVNEGGNDQLMRLESFIYSMNGNTLSDFSVYMTRYTCMKMTKCLELSIDDEKNEIKLGWNKGKELPLVKCVCKIPLCATLGGLEKLYQRVV